MSDRLAFIGKADPDEFVTEQRDDFDALPRQFDARPTTGSGVGYRQPGHRGGRFGASVGTGSMHRPSYVKGTYQMEVPRWSVTCCVARNGIRRPASILAPPRALIWSG